MNLSINSDNIIDSYINDISSGNQKSFENLYNITKKSVFGLAFALLNNKDDAEDVMQDTYINILKHASKYDSQNKPLAWIFTITKNLCLIKLKKNKNSINISNSFLESLLEQKDNHYDKALVKMIFEEISEEEKKIVILSSVCGFKFREISKLLDLNLSTVLSKYNRAIKKIRSIYKEDMK